MSCYLVYSPADRIAREHGDDLLAAADTADQLGGYVIDSDTRHPVPDEDIAAARARR